MADNFTWEESASGIEFASDDVSGVHYQKVKLAFGADDSATDVVPGAGLPVNPVGGIFGVETVDDEVSQDPVMAGLIARHGGLKLRRSRAEPYDALC